MDPTRLLYAQAMSVIDQKLQISAHNLSHANTPAFQEDVALVESRTASYQNEQVLSFPQHMATTRLTSLGPLEPSSNPFDFALGQPNTYFAVRDKNGQTFYTRNGQMTLMHDGPTSQDAPSYLVMASNGYKVLGLDGSPIEIPRTAENIAVSQKGEITAEDKQLGAFGVFRFPPEVEANVERVGSNLLRLRQEGATAPAATKYQVLQNYTEGSNVRPALTMMSLLELQNSATRMKNVFEIDHKQQKEAAEHLLVSA